MILRPTVLMQNSEHEFNDKWPQQVERLLYMSGIAGVVR